jgi:HD-GYP domain-containing protein (c-di-GMP phosphodiesterase class II)
VLRLEVEKLIQVSLNEVKSGQQLARAVFGPKGEVLLSSGFQLTPDVVRKLGALSDVGQKSFWVYEEGLKDIKPPVLVSDITRHNLVLGLKDTCEALYNRLASDQEHDLDFYLKNPAAARALLDLTVLRRLLKETLRELNRVNPPLLNLTGIAGSGLTFYENAVDAVITAVIIAKRYAYADNEVEDLAMGTLLCDIGYFFLPEKLRNRNHRISFAEFCLLKEHPVLGFELLKDNPLLPLVAAHVVLQHHERQDGGWLS